MITTDSPTQIITRELRNPARDPVRILCVEDNDLDFILIHAHLKEAAFSAPIKVHHARSMREAVQLLEASEQATAYDIVLLDLLLPDSQGVETYRQIRAAAPLVAVAILSSNQDQELAIELVQHGAQDYLPKDALTPDLLMRCIVYAMKRQRHRVGMQHLTDKLRQATEELKTTQMQLIQSEKAESLNRLASSVAHEVKSPLAVIQMGLDFLTAQRPSPDDKVNLTLTLMQEAVTRADSVIHDMLDFSRSNDRRFGACDMSDIVQCVVRMLKHELELRKITLHLEIADTPLRTHCDRNGIEQVLINIVMNALQAMEKGKVLTVRAKLGRATNIPRDEGLREMNVLRSGDQVVIIEVQDQGTGIPEASMNRIFEPFFTTKPTGEGTGLGLSVCKSIIDLHRGRLLVANVEEPRGLQVSIILKAETFTENEPAANSEPLSKIAIPHEEAKTP